VAEEDSETIKQTPEEMFVAHLHKMKIQKQLHDFDKRIAKCKQRTLSDFAPKEDSP